MYAYIHKNCTFLCLPCKYSQLFVMYVKLVSAPTLVGMGQWYFGLKVHHSFRNGRSGGGEKVAIITIFVHSLHIQGSQICTKKKRQGCVCIFPIDITKKKRKHLIYIRKWYASVWNSLKKKKQQILFHSLTSLVLYTHMPFALPSLLSLFSASSFRLKKGKIYDDGPCLFSNGIMPWERKKEKRLVDLLFISTNLAVFSPRNKFVSFSVFWTDKFLRGKVKNKKDIPKKKMLFWLHRCFFLENKIPKRK